ncbi:MAG: phenylacetate--CoA ligase family protein [Alphaproteobacteria bacterium]|nr:MAG: phenylacetate--CoA ligase family protein [Alphaproteobacteria bacterium]
MKSLKIGEIIQLASQFITQLYGIEKRPHWSYEKIQNYQLKQLKLRLQEARDLVPMYKGKNLPAPEEIKTLADWRKIPILTKDELLSFEPVQRINSNYNINELIVSKSSGSTGKALDVYYDLASFNLFILAGLRLYRMAFKYRPWHRQTYIYTSPYPLNSLLGAYPLEFISTLNPIEDTIEKLRKNPPDLLVCYPSHLRSIADKMTAEDFKIIHPQVINVNSEMSSPVEREYLGKKFGSFVFDDYSSEELTRIASQCRNHSYHLFDDINYIEIVDEQGQPVPDNVVGNIVGTNLHNKGMPLLRYLQGDRGSISSRKCECGRNFRILETLEGRKNDAFTLSSGETLSSGFLLDLTYGVFLNYPGCVNAFCLIQETADQWYLEIVPGEHWSAELENKIPSELMSDLKREQVKIKTQIVKDVTKTKSGKANPIISRVKK